MSVDWSNAQSARCGSPCSTIWRCGAGVPDTPSDHIRIVLGLAVFVGQPPDTVTAEIIRRVLIAPTRGPDLTTDHHRLRLAPLSAPSRTSQEKPKGGLCQDRSAAPKQCSPIFRCFWRPCPYRGELADNVRAEPDRSVYLLRDGSLRWAASSIRSNVPAVSESYPAG